jgi:DNA-binding CsgD family transcriptional regulator
MRVAAQIALSEEQRATLESWSRGRKTPARLVLRAKIVLHAAEGLENREIALKLGLTGRVWAAGGHDSRSSV